MSVVLVTGAGGFVGSAIVRQLVSSAASGNGAVEHVVALLRPGSSLARLEELEGIPGWSVERADLMDRDALLDVFEQIRPRAVIHAALDLRAYEREDGELVSRPLEHLLEGLAPASGCRFVQVGSAWILASGDRLDESAPVDPATAYGRNKAHEEVLLAELAAQRRVPWVTLRLFNLFGRYEDEKRLVPTLVARLSRGEPVELTHGEQVRDFNDVDVAARAFVNVLAAPESACGAVYHVGSGRGTKVRDLALRVAGFVGADGHLIRFGTSATQDEHVPVLVSDPSLARDVLHWKPDLDLPSRIREIVDWWLVRLGRREAREVPA